MDILSQLRPLIFEAVIPEISNSLEALAQEHSAKIAYLMKPREGNMILQIIKIDDEGKQEVIKEFAFADLPQFLIGNLEKAGDLALTIQTAENLAQSFGVDFSIKDIMESLGADISRANQWTSENKAEGLPVRFLMLNKEGKKLKKSFWAKIGLAQPKEVEANVLVVYIEKETELAYEQIEAFPLIELLKRLKI